MKKLLMLGMAVMMATATGCAATEADDSSAAAEGESVDEMISSDPMSVPKTMVTFLRTEKWGDHHLEWHTVRQWDRLRPTDQAWAKRQGWARADIMEGAPGNGLEFLAMHRVMIRTLTEKFPRSAKLFTGWEKPPIDNADKADPATDPNPFDAKKAEAVDKLMNHLADFKSDDEFGLYMETTLRPKSSDPQARSTDRSAGIHNYLHFRFQDANSKINIGDPSVNLANRRFWRLHGWIESRWTEFRKLKGLSDEDPSYQAAIQKGEAMVNRPAARGMGDGFSFGLAPADPPPASLREFFAKDP